MKPGQRVYFIKPVGMDGPIKIGCSDKPARRLLTLAAWSPFELEMIGSVPGSFRDENALHRRFANLHTRKEWFMSSPLLRQTIELILAGTPIKEACKVLPERGVLRKRQPARTPERKLFLQYGARVRSAAHSVWHSGEHTKHYIPPDIRSILHEWRMDRMNDHLPVKPTPEQFARLDAFIADPAPHCVSFEESYGRPWPLDEKVA
jgi:hypothetical protein